MKTIVRSVFAAVALSAVITGSTFAAEEAGYVDFGKLTAAADAEFVEIDLDCGLLSVAAKFAPSEYKDAGEIVENLKRVRVNVVGLDDSNRNAVLERVQHIRTNLAEKGWSKVVTVNEGQAKGGNNVMILTKTNGSGTIEGVMVTVIEGKGKAVLVNVMGDIKLEQLAKLGETLKIQGLKDLKTARK